MPSHRESPPPAFRQIVETLWLAARDLSCDGGFVVTPDQFVDLLLFDADVFAEHAGMRRALPRCVLLGPLTQPLRLGAAGMVRCAGIRLRAWAAGMLCPNPSADAPWSDATPLVGHAATDIVTALRRDDHPKVFRLLRRLLDDLMPVADDPSLPPTAALLAEPVRAFSTALVARGLGVGPRQAERRFKASTRLSPRQFAGVARFQFVRDRLWLDPDSSLAGLAIEAGYADQAHMTREFRRYAGVPPRAFAESCRQST